MEESQSNLVMPPQIPTSVMVANQNENNPVYTIYAQIINSEKILYRNLLRKLYSADYIEIDGFIEIPDEQGKMQRIPNPQVKIVKLPSSQKECPVCHKTGSEETFFFCEHKYEDTLTKLQQANQKQEVMDAKDLEATSLKTMNENAKNPKEQNKEKDVKKGKKEDEDTKKAASRIVKVKTRYLNWKPLLNDDGFNKIISDILAGTDEIMSTGNINVDKKGEQVPMKNMALQSASTILQEITENIYDWSFTGQPNITEGQYKIIGEMVSDHFLFTMSRSKDAYLLENMASTSRFLFKGGTDGNPMGGGQQPSPKKERSFMDVLFGKN